MLLIAITWKKNCFHPFGKRVLNIWKHGIVHAFSEFFRQENSKLSLCFRVGELEYSFHKNRTPSYNQLDLERRKRVAKSYSRLSQRKWGTNNSDYELSWSSENELPATCRKIYFTMQTHEWTTPTHKLSRLPTLRMSHAYPQTPFQPLWKPIVLVLLFLWCQNRWVYSSASWCVRQTILTQICKWIKMTATATDRAGVARMYFKRLKSHNWTFAWQ